MFVLALEGAKPLMRASLGEAVKRRLLLSGIVQSEAGYAKIAYTSEPFRAITIASYDGNKDSELYVRPLGTLTEGERRLSDELCFGIEHQSPVTRDFLLAASRIKSCDLARKAGADMLIFCNYFLHAYTERSTEAGGVNPPKFQSFREDTIPDMTIVLQARACSHDSKKYEDALSFIRKHNPSTIRVISLEEYRNFTSLLDKLTKDVMDWLKQAQKS